MKLKLKEGKQRALILLAKKERKWKELAEELQINSHYLYNELAKEKILISEEKYKELSRLTNSNFDDYIVEKLNDNWGRSKGGLKSTGSTIKIKIPKRNEKLAELVGAILGDGNINFYSKGKKIGVYQVTITGHKELDKNYHLKYLSPIFLELFNVKGKERVDKKSNTRNLFISSKELVNYFIEQGLKSGDKIRNQVTIPEWIKENKEYLKACLRGLIDTDGSIFRMSNKDPKLMRINFTNYNNRLLKDARESFISLGFNPSKTIKDKQFFISRKEDIRKYLKEVGFSNKKHQDRLLMFTAL